MNDVRMSQFKALCPNCGKTLTDRTYIDQKDDMYFFRTIFECESDNWALMTRMDEFNSIAFVNETDPGNIMASLFAQIKLDMTIAVIGNFISDGVRDYPLDTVEKFMENGETFYSKRMTGRASAALHLFYRNLAASYGQQGELEKQKLALQAAVQYLMGMEGEELDNLAVSETECQEAQRVFRTLTDLLRAHGDRIQADEVAQHAKCWQQRTMDVKEMNVLRQALADDNSESSPSLKRTQDDYVWRGLSRKKACERVLGGNPLDLPWGFYPVDDLALVGSSRFYWFATFDELMSFANEVLLDQSELEDARLVLRIQRYRDSLAKLQKPQLVPPDAAKEFLNSLDFGMKWWGHFEGLCKGKGIFSTMIRVNFRNSSDRTNAENSEPIRTKSYKEFADFLTGYSIP